MPNAQKAGRCPGANQVRTSCEPAANQLRTRSDPAANQVRSSPNRTQLAASGANPVRIAFQLLGEAAPRELMSGAVGGYKSTKPARTTAKKWSAGISARAALALSSSSSSLHPSCYVKASLSQVQIASRMAGRQVGTRCEPAANQFRTSCDPVPIQVRSRSDRAQLAASAARALRRLPEAVSRPG